MNQAQQIGTISSDTDKLFVQRLGEQITLQQGDAVYAGDVLQNKDDMSIEILLPAQKAGQADSLLKLSPDSSAQVIVGESDEDAALEVISLTDGVELYSVSDGGDGALLQTDSGEAVSGLIGVDLLAAGSTGGTNMLVTAIGSVFGVTAIAASSGDDSNAANPPGFTENPSDNGEGTTDPGENPEPPTEPVDNTTGTTGTPLDVVLDPLFDVLGSTPLAVITDPLVDTLGSLPIGSASNLTNTLPLDAITGNLPG